MIEQLKDALVIDLESTGVDPQNDRIIEVAWGDVTADVIGTNNCTFLVNPQRPVPADVLTLTGIKAEDLEQAKPFAEYAAMLAMLLEGRPLVGFGIVRFDWPLLAAEFDRCGVSVKWGPIIDLDAIYKQLRPRNLAAAVRDFCGIEHTDAHRAFSDVLATRRVLLAMLNGQHIPTEHTTSVDSLATYSQYGEPCADPGGKLRWKNGKLIYGFGKVKGQHVLDDIGFARWMRDRANFPRATIEVLWNYIEANSTGVDDDRPLF